MNKEINSVVKTHFGSRFVKALFMQSSQSSIEDFLAEPAFSCATRLQLSRDDGKTSFLPAWRIRYLDIFGPCKGGVRFHESVSADTLTTLAARILVKCAANSLPHGGAAGGVCVNPKTLSAREHKELAERYVNAYADSIGEDKDILSPDLGTSSTTMAWMSKQLNRQNRRFEPAAINGKPIALGGISGRPGATAKGACLVLEQLFTLRNLGFQGATTAIQGFGAAGGTLALELADRGVRIVAVSDSSGGWYDSQGLAIRSLLAAKSSGLPLGSQQVKGARSLSPGGALEVPADFVIAAALGGQINKANADRLRCRFVVEIANAAVTDEAEDILGLKGIEVVPDIIVNSGGITVSHFEWTQNRSGTTMDSGEVHALLQSRMLATTTKWLEQAAENKVSLTIAAQMLAINRIREALVF